MPIWCWAGKVTECSMCRGDEEEGDAFLVVAFCSSATIRGEGDWNAPTELQPVVEVSATRFQNRQRRGKRQLRQQTDICFQFLESLIITVLCSCCPWTPWTSTFSLTDFTSHRSTVLNQGHSHSSLSSKSGRHPRQGAVFTMAS